MKFRIILPPVGGLFSQLHMGICILIKETNLEDVESFNLSPSSIYINKKDNYIIESFSGIYEMTDDDSYIQIKDDNITIEYDKYLSLSNPFSSIDTVKSLLSKIRIKQEFLSSVDDYVNSFNINKNTLGVHIRLTDMNKYHTNEYGNLYYDDFLMKIKKVLKDNSSIDNIFISSDNYESIEKIKKDLDDIKISYIENIKRCELETSDNYQFQLDNLKSDEYIKSTFTEMYLLSKCSYLVHRISGFALFTILYSETLSEDRVFQIKNEEK